MGCCQVNVDHGLQLEVSSTGSQDLPIIEALLFLGFLGGCVVVGIELEQRFLPIVSQLVCMSAIATMIAVLIWAFILGEYAAVVSVNAATASKSSVFRAAAPQMDCMPHN